MRRPVRGHERPEISHWCNAYWELPAPRRCSCCGTLPAFSAGAVTPPVRRRGDRSAVDRSWRYWLDRLPRTPLHAGHTAALWMTSTTSNPWTGSLACRPPAGACSRDGRRLRNACIDSRRARRMPAPTRLDDGDRGVRFAAASQNATRAIRAWRIALARSPCPASRSRTARQEPDHFRPRLRSSASAVGMRPRNAR